MTTRDTPEAALAAALHEAMCVSICDPRGHAAESYWQARAAAILVSLDGWTLVRRHVWTTDDKHDYEWCRACLLVRQRNGSTDTKPCKGPAKVELRDTPEAAK